MLINLDGKIQNAQRHTGADIFTLEDGSVVRAEQHHGRSTYHTTEVLTKAPSSVSESQLLLEASKKRKPKVVKDEQTEE